VSSVLKRERIVPPEPPALCVLASGSSGNCSVLLTGPARAPRATLIDAGLSPRRVAALLAERGLGMHQVDAIVLTHLDRDHWHPAWTKKVRDLAAPVFVHASHLGRATREGVLPRRTEKFVHEVAPVAGVRATAMMMSHDDLGVAAFRFELEGDAGTLGFATDVGRVTGDLIDHLAGVDTLAIESNYCPDMQRASDRPEFLKRRIMGGAGHLSNHECADAVARIAPREHVVFLHLSRQCNRPELVGAMHAGADYAWTITSQHEATRWIPLRAGTPREPGVIRTSIPAPPEPSQLALF
jgi:phosphoribosyl 1,2-cyclic phosphodiesterase